MSKRIRAILLVALSVVSALMLSGCSNNKNEEESREKIVEVTITMEPNEHILSVPIDKGHDVRKEIVQHEYHEGYVPAAISLTAYGRTSNNFGGGAIVYINNEEVLCTTARVNENGNYVFDEFGQPNREVVETEDKPQVKEFGPGEHIISVPIPKLKDGDNRKQQLQIEYHDGYTVVGEAATAYGMTSNNFGGGCILYVNTESVVCTLDENGEYTHFGAPLHGMTLKIEQ